jgi:hypothetical protein
MSDESTREYRESLQGHLTELVDTLNRLRKALTRGKAADADEVRELVRVLTEGVCDRWAAIIVSLPAPHASQVEYGGRRFSNHAEILYLQALEMYQQLTELTEGYPDDVLMGGLEEDEAWEHWPEFVEQYHGSGSYLDEVDIARLAGIAQKELRLVVPKPWPLPYVYNLPASPADRWSPEAARSQTGRLAGYREEGPPNRQANSESDDVADLMKAAAGEPPDRFATKLGGLPYRPSSIPWPRHASGEPMVFLGQICFADSLDVVGELPGDVLLIFTHDEHDHTSGGNLHYEWYPLGLDGLIAATDVPDTRWKVYPCYMHLVRSEEESDGLISAKIGGRPHWIQHEPRDPGRFLGGFESVKYLGKPRTDDPKVRHLDMFDNGLLHFFLLEDGHVVEYFQCY